jgi:hypothetical protein
MRKPVALFVARHVVVLSMRKMSMTVLGIVALVVKV